ncbi:MAG: hypothetical protein M1834_007561 [Cirrosporium novae-zelandiae]|nr:MAG: hypothetical protein M1834_007561 [Cirrosporium novae-zelandiae]
MSGKNIHLTEFEIQSRNEGWVGTPSSESNTRLLSPDHQQNRPPLPHRSSVSYLLKKSKKDWFTDTLIDVTFVMIPLPFLLLAGVMIVKDDKKVDQDKYQNLQEASTLFPYCFAAVVGRATIKFASWMLQRGTTLGLLEHLMGSRSFGAAMTTLFQLRSFNVVGILVILLWCLSPLGAQSLLHVFSTTQIPIPSTANISYINSRAAVAAENPPLFGNWFSSFGALFSASLLAPMSVKQGPADIWGNVKIPFYSNLSSSGEKQGWRNVSQSNSIQYSSLFGIPLSGIPEGNSSFTLESTYLELNCTKINSLPLGGPFTIRPEGPYVSYRNVTYDYPWAIGYKGSYLPEKYKYLPSNISNSAFDAGSLLYLDMTGYNNDTYVYCTPSQAYVESRINCTKATGSKNCSVIEQRLSTLPHLPTNLTRLSITGVIQEIGALLPNATAQFGFIDIMQNYIYCQDPTFIQSKMISYVDKKESRFLRLPLQDFGPRLAQILNAFLYSIMYGAIQYLTGAEFKFQDPQEFFSLGTNVSGMIRTRIVNGSSIAINSTKNPEEIDSMISNGTAIITMIGDVTNLRTVYVCSRHWVMALIISSSAMLATAIIGVVFNRKLTMPECLGYVSSLARESPYAPNLSGDPNLDGMQRARAMKNLKLRFGEVSNLADGTGWLAIGEVENVAHAKQGREYMGF